MSILATPVAGGDNRRVPPRVSSPEFVGRAAELARLEAALERAERGSAAAAFVAGESGVGKTRLLRELERRAVERGARVLRGDCVAFGAGERPCARRCSLQRSRGSRGALASHWAGRTRWRKMAMTPRSTAWG